MAGMKRFLTFGVVLLGVISSEDTIYKDELTLFLNLRLLRCLLHIFTQRVLFSASCGRPAPTIDSQEDEFVLSPLSEFNISCMGDNVVWAEPLPGSTFVLPGSGSSTLFIYNASVEHTGPYTCLYRHPDARPGDQDQDEDEDGASIYVFVPGEE